MSVEGGIKIARSVILGASPVIGSLFVLLYRDKYDQFEKAVATGIKEGDGLMIFDVCYLIKYNLWEILKRGISWSNTD